MRAVCPIKSLTPREDQLSHQTIAGSIVLSSAKTIHKKSMVKGQKVRKEAHEGHDQALWAVASVTSFFPSCWHYINADKEQNDSQSCDCESISPSPLQLSNPIVNLKNIYFLLWKQLFICFLKKIQKRLSPGFNTSNLSHMTNVITKLKCWRH